MRIHQVKTRYSNSYVVEQAGRLLVIDVAKKCHGQVITFIEKKLGLSRDAVACVVCTHDDFDHMGGVRALAKACHAQLCLPWASASHIKKMHNDPTAGVFKLATGMRELMRPRAWNMYFNPQRDHRATEHHYLETEFEHEPFYPYTRLKHLQTLPGFPDWQLLHTPGHSWDSCCFYHANSHSLVTGDTILGSGQLGRLVKPAIYANPFHMRKTIRKLRALKLENIYPGHGSSFHGAGLLDHL